MIILAFCSLFLSFVAIPMAYVWRKEAHSETTIPADQLNKQVRSTESTILTQSVSSSTSTKPPNSLSLTHQKSRPLKMGIDPKGPFNDKSSSSSSRSSKTVKHQQPLTHKTPIETLATNVILPPSYIEKQVPSNLVKTSQIKSTKRLDAKVNWKRTEWKQQTNKNNIKLEYKWKPRQITSKKFNINFDCALKPFAKLIQRHQAQWWLAWINSASVQWKYCSSCVCAYSFSQFIVVVVGVCLLGKMPLVDWPTFPMPRSQAVNGCKSNQTVCSTLSKFFIKDIIMIITIMITNFDL